MARPGRGADAVLVTLRVPRSLLDRVDRAAAERVVSRSWLISQLIEKGLERLIPVEELMLVRPPPEH